MTFSDVLTRGPFEEVPRHPHDASEISGDAILLSLKVSNLYGGTIEGEEIIVAGGADGILRSDNFVSGSDGWRILGDGSAEFNDVTVRGTIIAGAGSQIGFDGVTAGANTASLTIGSGGTLESSNFVTGSSGWQIDGDGNAEFQDVTVRGVLTSETGSAIDWTHLTNISVDNADINSLSFDKITAATNTASLVIGAAGTIESANYAAGTDGFHIGGDGNAEFNDVTVRGALIAGASSDIDWQYVTSVSVATADIENAAITNAKIDTMSVSKLTGGEISGETITLDTTSVGIIKSDNYSSGSAGWQIEGNGDVEFNDGTFRGTLEAAKFITADTSSDRIEIDPTGNVWAVEWYDNTVRKAYIQYQSAESVLEVFGDPAQPVKVHVSGDDGTQVGAAGTLSLAGETDIVFGHGAGGSQLFRMDEAGNGSRLYGSETNDWFEIDGTNEWFQFYIQDTEIVRLVGDNASGESVLELLDVLEDVGNHEVLRLNRGTGTGLQPVGYYSSDLASKTDVRPLTTPSSLEYWQREWFMDLQPIVSRKKKNTPYFRKLPYEMRTISFYLENLLENTNLLTTKGEKPGNQPDEQALLAVTVDYVQHLQEQVVEMREEYQEMKKEIEQLKAAA